jgi:hypothetical protein
MNAKSPPIGVALALSFLTTGREAQPITNETANPTPAVTLDQKPAAEDGGVGRQTGQSGGERLPRAH